jgi:hypothetical protein
LSVGSAWDTIRRERLLALERMAGAVTLERFNPTVPVIVMSGFDLDRGEIAPGGAVDRILRKPPTLTNIREVLADAASRPTA